MDWLYYPTFLLLIFNFLIPAQTAYVSAFPASTPERNRLEKRNQNNTLYDWENAWEFVTDNDVSKTTTITFGNVPPNSGLSYGMPLTWSYSFKFDSDSDSRENSTYTQTPVKPQNTVKPKANQPKPTAEDTKQKPPPSSSQPPPTKPPPTQQQPTSSTQSNKAPPPPNNSPQVYRPPTTPGTKSPPSRKLVESAPGVKDAADNTNLDPGLVTSGSQEQAWLSVHNSYRRMYGVSDLEWSDDLSQQAASRADQCIWEHTRNNPNGENLAAGQEDPASSVVAWVEGPNEREVWDPNAPTYTHFTQVVWKNTRQLGCAYKSCSTIEGSSLPQSPVAFWVCQYHPAGNVQGKYVENVLAHAGGVPKSQPAGSPLPESPLRDDNALSLTRYTPAPLEA